MPPLRALLAEQQLPQSAARGLSFLLGTPSGDESDDILSTFCAESVKVVVE